VKKKKIDKHQYRSLYLQSKGNKFKTKKNLIETIHKLKTDKKKSETITNQIEARKKKAKELRERKISSGVAVTGSSEKKAAPES